MIAKSTSGKSTDTTLKNLMQLKKRSKKGSMMTTYTGAHGMADAKLRVSKKVFDSINDLTRLGRCCAKSCAKKPPKDVP